MGEKVQMPNDIRRQEIRLAAVEEGARSIPIALPPPLPLVWLVHLKATASNILQTRAFNEQKKEEDEEAESTQAAAAAAAAAVAAAQI